ncbi:MAG: sugar transferase [Eubacteriales bacterium]
MRQVFKLYLYVKRIIDFIISLLGIVILSPVFLVLIILIKIDSKGPIFFKQKRVGKDKRYFNIFKFRTMRIDTPKDTPTHMLENPEQYITKVGRFLRKTSLDELPQIANILIGHMSCVGPRPALWNQFDLVNERDKYIGKYGLTVNGIRPGLTGWAQINGRDELPIEEKARLDGEYIKKISFLFDIKCFLGTFISVIKSDGVVEGGTGELEKAKAKEASEVKK